jgi:Mrp family chromosome partitioning ATPase
MTALTSARYHKLRIQIELSTPAPSLIMVTSGKASDGGSIAANGLADCLAAAGHRVALLARDLKSAGTDNKLRISLFRISEILDAGSRPSDAVAALAEKMRGRYDYTIIDAPPLAESSVSMLLASTVQAVLLTIRLGRSKCPEDALMMEALERAHARVLGVIAVSDASIREFERADHAGVANDGRRVAGSPPNGKASSSIATVS